MASAAEKIEALLERLEQTGADPVRLDVLRCTQRFKRSWVELAETLVAVRRDESFRAWGYEDFHTYCAQELFLRRATVDKLTVSYSTLQRLAPSVLKWDGVEREVPSYQAVDYFGKAVDAAREPAPGRRKQEPKEVIKELRHAVFDEGQSVGELRKRFDPIIRPQPKGTEQLQAIQKALGTSRRLADLLPEIDGLSDKRMSVVERTLGALRQELEQLAEPLRERVQAAKMKRRKKAPPRE